jgi:hypothetical protein
MAMDDIIAATESESESDGDLPRFQLHFKRPLQQPNHHAWINNTSYGQTEHANSSRSHPAVDSFCDAAPPLTVAVKTEGDAEAIVRMRPPGYATLIKQEPEMRQGARVEGELLLVEGGEDDEISESSIDSLDAIDDDEDDLLFDDEEDIKENRSDAPSISGLRSLLPSPSNQHQLPREDPKPDNESKWYLLLPDFIPVRELARGIDPRNGTKVHVLYNKQFTSESSSAHARDKDKNVGAGSSGGVLYDEDLPEPPKKIKRRKSHSEGTGGGSGGSWYHSDGKKVFRDANGNELTGRAAWAAYKGGKAKKKSSSKKRKFKRGRKSASDV